MGSPWGVRIRTVRTTAPPVMAGRPDSCRPTAGPSANLGHLEVLQWPGRLVLCGRRHEWKERRVPIDSVVLQVQAIANSPVDPLETLLVVEAGP
eukprot:6761466-Pyramimonas_sp.AAC.1